MSGTIVGNLDAEEELTGGKARLPARVLDAISAAATLLRVFASPGDHLWTPAPVEDARVAEVEWLPRCQPVTGPLEDVDPGDRLLAWCETPRVAALRATLSRSATAATGHGAIVSAASPATLWEIPPPPADVVRRANHRELALEIAREHGIALDGSRMIDSIGALEAHLARGGAALSGTGRWVVKAPWSAAGRWRRVGGPGPLDDTARRAIENLLERSGALLFEPWLERVDDLGATALVVGEGLAQIGFHRQDVDGYGRFRGVRLRRDRDAAPWLSSAERDAVEGALAAVGDRLRAIGYRGPLTIDGWRYRSREGEIRLHPLGEINARITFGLVARALLERLHESVPLGADDEGTLGVGGGTRTAEPPPALVVPLVHATEHSSFRVALHVEQGYNAG